MTIHTRHYNGCIRELWLPSSFLSGAVLRLTFRLGVLDAPISFHYLGRAWRPDKQSPLGACLTLSDLSVGIITYTGRVVILPVV